MNAFPHDAMPAAWRDRLGHYRWHHQTTGLSGANLYRLEADDLPALYLKVDEASPFSAVEAEALRLPRLAAHSIACPSLVDFQMHEGRNWLLTHALAGRDAAVLGETEPSTAVAIVARALRELHARPIANCPFDRRLATRIALVRRRIQAGDVDEEEFADDGGPAAALEALLAKAPTSEDLVLAHGDATLSNVILDGGSFSGFVDCGRFGVADRYQDLALACDSITDFLGEDWVAPFLAQYGLDAPDRDRLAFYERFDAFF
ncbi:MAG TPA: APH(3') family aminoglycoside O-phosphotransferase [Beijerinckiaceae bacterium]|nr:APH(3') family aminoglycoside O-phosphotransferase [Beijerinckiaceae bacterium]